MKKNSEILTVLENIDLKFVFLFDLMFRWNWNYFEC